MKRICKTCGGNDFYLFGACRVCSRFCVIKTVVRSQKKKSFKFSTTWFVRPLSETVKTQMRRAKNLGVIPKWFGEFDEFVMKEAVRLSRVRERLTGFKWEVDHIVPLQGGTVTGFHIGCNIQVIPKVVNMRKNSYYWEGMP